MFGNNSSLACAPLTASVCSAGLHQATNGGMIIRLDVEKSPSRRFWLQGKWWKEEFWIPLAEWWIDTVLGTWEESVKVGQFACMHQSAKCYHYMRVTHSIHTFSD